MTPPRGRVSSRSGAARGSVLTYWLRIAPIAIAMQYLQDLHARGKIKLPAPYQPGKYFGMRMNLCAEMEYFAPDERLSWQRILFYGRGGFDAINPRHFPSQQPDFREPEVLTALEARLGGRRVDVVLSDMAPNLSGIATADAARMTELVELAIEFARAHLVPDGALVCKLFHGSGYSQLVKRFKDEFRTVKPIKPKASRAKSAETFVVGIGLKPRASGPDIHA